MHMDGEPERLPVFREAIATGRLPAGLRRRRRRRVGVRGQRARASASPRARGRVSCGCGADGDGGRGRDGAGGEAAGGRRTAARPNCSTRSASMSSGRCATAAAAGHCEVAVTAGLRSFMLTASRADPANPSGQEAANLGDAPRAVPPIATRAALERAGRARHADQPAAPGGCSAPTASGPEGLFGGCRCRSSRSWRGWPRRSTDTHRAPRPGADRRIVVCALGTMEITGREHFTGYRAHTACWPRSRRSRPRSASWRCSGDPSQRGLLLLAVIVPVYALCFLRCGASARSPAERGWRVARPRPRRRRSRAGSIPGLASGRLGCSGARARRRSRGARA